MGSNPSDNFFIVLYEEQEVLFDKQTEPWMTQAQIAKMLGITVQTVNRMLKYAYEHGDITDESVISLRLKARDGKTYEVGHYNLDAILLIGFRSKATSKAIHFRQWVGQVIRHHLQEVLHELEKHLEMADHLEQELKQAQDELILQDLESRYGASDEWQ